MRVVSNASLFIKKDSKYVLFVLVYVDNILIIGFDTDALHACIKDLDTYFSLKTLGSVNYFLDFEAHRDVTGIYLTQSKYSLDLL